MAKKWPLCSQSSKQNTVAAIGDQVKNIDIDQCIDTDIHTSSDDLVSQLRQEIQVKAKEMQKRDKKNRTT